MRGLLVAAILTLLLFASRTAYADNPFPIHVSKSQKFFEDANGKPVLLQGDSAWSLIAELNREDTELYLTDRKKRGFNALLVNLIEHQFSSRPPANFYGDKPFLGAAFGELNPAYFDHAEWVVRRAKALGLAVFLTPAYLGVNGSDQGWFKEAEAAGPDQMRSYGAAIARRFAGYDNIIWVLGGDFDAPDRELVIQLANGLKLAGSKALVSVHSGRDTNTFDLWGDQTWLSFDTVYTYDDVHAAILERSENPSMPVILLESSYEFERETTAQRIRRNAYGAVLAGAAGQFYGNNPIWHFTGPGVFPADRTWKEALDSPGSWSMTILGRLFDRLPWWQLQPDRENRIAADTSTYAAAKQDMSLIILYGNADGFDLNRDAVNAGFSASWFDPASGRFFKAEAPKISEDHASYTPPPNRDMGIQSDWILLLGTEPFLKAIQKK